MEELSAIRHRARLEAVRRSGLLDSEPEIVFDELTRAAARLLGAPFAFMTAVDETRSFWKSTVGIEDGTRSNAVEDSFCQYVIERGDELIVGDARVDDVTHENPSIESMGVVAWAGSPVWADGQIVGTFCVVDQKVRDWTEDERELLRELAAIASREVTQRARAAHAAADHAAALARADNAEELLDALRISMSPGEVAGVEGVDLASWCQAAHDGHLLLGDFHDVLPSAEGRTVVVVGDVCGHGARAARLTAMMRYTLRAALVHTQDLAAAVAELDRAVRADAADDGRFATLCALRLSPGAGSLTVDYVRAGHPYPILVSPTRGVRLLTGGGGMPVGLSRDVGIGWVAQSIELQAGEFLVVYTDGASECIDADGAMVGDHGLVAALAETRHLGSSSEVTEVVRRRVTGASSKMDDDVIVVAIGAVASSPDGAVDGAIT